MINSSTLSTRHRRALFLCLAVALAHPGLSAWAQPTATASAPAAQADALSEKDRAEVFEKVWAEVSEKYFDATFNGTDWNAVRARYRPLAAGAKTDAEFYALINRMLGELRDGHTLFLTPRVIEARKRGQTTSTGVTLREVEGQTVVFAVEADSDAAREGVEAGMIVRAIDGEPVAARLAAARNEVSESSSERLTRLRIYARLLAGAANTTFKLGLERADETRLEVTLTRRTISSTSKVVAYLLPSGNAYLKFDSFREGVAKELKPLIEKFRDAPALVIDLRQSSGGEVQEMLKVAGYFFNEKVFMARGVNRTGKPISLLGGLVKVPLEAYAGEPGGQVFAKPVVVLTGERTASAAENFTQGLKENGRATIVGTQTCGCVNVVSDAVNVKGGGALQLSELGYRSAKGVKLEGVGVTPDIAVSLTLADLRARRDAWLEAAEKFLKSLDKK